MRGLRLDPDVIDRVDKETEECFDIERDPDGGRTQLRINDYSQGEAAEVLKA